MEDFELLLKMRVEYLEGKHRIPDTTMYDHAAAICALTKDNEQMGRILSLLDGASPGGNFHLFIDGVEVLVFPDGEYGFTYGHDRTHTGIAGTIGKAAMRARAGAA